jgi:hypothetical protein
VVAVAVAGGLGLFDLSSWLKLCVLANRLVVSIATVKIFFIIVLFF